VSVAPEVFSSTALSFSRDVETIGAPFGANLFAHPTHVPECVALNSDHTSFGGHSLFGGRDAARGVIFEARRTRLGWGDADTRAPRRDERRLEKAPAAVSQLHVRAPTVGEPRIAARVPPSGGARAANADAMRWPRALTVPIRVRVAVKASKGEGRQMKAHRKRFHYFKDVWNSQGSH
jgi:hypothetical protein